MIMRDLAKNQTLLNKFLIKYFWMRIRVRTPSRIHICLIDMSGKIGRVDGGAGIALEEPHIEVVGEAAEKTSVNAEEAINTERFREVSEKLSRFSGKKASIRVVSDYESHSGLGSGTQISLAVGQIYSRLFNLNLSVREIAEITGRGGTSGIGVSAFEYGGFIVDGGHSIKEKKSFMPSSASRAAPPPVIFRHDFPEWKVVVAVPGIKGFSGRDEMNLFEKYCPVEINDVREISHLILMKMIPAVIEEDLDDFGDAVWRIQHLGFKKVEVQQYEGLVKKCMEYIREITPAVGMSSTGPVIYSITDSSTKTIERTFYNYFREKDMNVRIIVTHARNKGADVEVLE